MNKTLLCLVMMTAFAATSAQAQSLEEKELRAKEEARLVNAAQHANTTCGVDFQPKVDWKSVPLAELKDRGVYSFCGEALSALARVCESAAGKPEVQKQIKQLSCQRGATRSVSVKGGVLTYVYNPDTANNAEFVYEQLQKSL